ncbi:hypothetical protein K1T71_006901 [Dendrolimus kikuchii]|uniref:Uncharacterized protein n=1 Tax=Dendrolimus kikuchii TaxID=765133 RepID=A0ACC1D033_9NEOP|nr:hypothetical protein K1T71_006901 [Dendrolimus kikuchii]
MVTARATRPRAGPAPADPDPPATEEQEEARTALAGGLQRQIADSPVVRRLSAVEYPPLPSQRASMETAVVTSIPPPPACPAPLPPPAVTEEGWTTVNRKKRAKNKAPPSSGTQPVTTAAAAQPTSAPRRGGRGRGGKGQGDVAQAPASQPPPPPPPAPKKKTAAKEKRSPRLRPPKSAAVVLTLQPGAAERGVTYANLFSKAKSRIRLADLGIEGGLKLRQARTGGRILVLPSASDASKADALAEQLRINLYPEDVRISRPEKTVCLRVSGLDDHAHEEDVAAAIARTTGCSLGSIKAHLRLTFPHTLIPLATL